MATHKELDVWKSSIELTKTIYEETKKFPKEEIYGIVSQMRRAAVSVPSNIAEGAARNSDKEFVRFLNISLGSLAELDTQVIISQKLGYIIGETLLKDIIPIRSKLYSLRNYYIKRIKK